MARVKNTVFTHPHAQKIRFHLVPIKNYCGILQLVHPHQRCESGPGRSEPEAHSCHNGKFSGVRASSSLPSFRFGISEPLQRDRTFHRRRHGLGWRESAGGDLAGDRGGELGVSTGAEGDMAIAHE